MIACSSKTADEGFCWTLQLCNQRGASRAWCRPSSRCYRGCRIRRAGWQHALTAKEGCPGAGAYHSIWCPRYSHSVCRNAWERLLLQLQPDAQTLLQLCIDSTNFVIAFKILKAHQHCQKLMSSCLGGLRWYPRNPTSSSTAWGRALVYQCCV